MKTTATKTQMVSTANEGNTLNALNTVYEHIQDSNKNIMINKLEINSLKQINGEILKSLISTVKDEIKIIKSYGEFTREETITKTLTRVKKSIKDNHGLKIDNSINQALKIATYSVVNKVHFKKELLTIGQMYNLTAFSPDKLRPLSKLQDAAYIESVKALINTAKVEGKTKVFKRGNAS